MSTRLKQRYQNFSKSLQLLEDALDIENPSIVEQAGTIQFYEMTFELAWKCLKDFFQEQGLDVKYPREVLKTGIEKEILSKGDVWMQALTDRNLTSHLYDEQAAIQAADAIRKSYSPLLVQLNAFLKGHLDLEGPE